jgi:hypothetical protein
MSKRKSKRQIRGERAENARRLLRNSKFNEVRICPNCGETLTSNGHMVPPCFGDDAMWICQKKRLDNE